MTAPKNWTLCAMTMGMARRSQVLDRSGSILALGAAYRLTAPVGTNGLRRFGRRASRPRGPRPRDRSGSLGSGPLTGRSSSRRPTRRCTGGPARAASALAHSERERSAVPRSSSGGRCPAMPLQIRIDGFVRPGEDAGALLGEPHRHPSPVVVLLSPVDQAACDEAVDDRGDGGASHGQALGQTRRRPRSPRPRSRAPGTGARSARPRQRHLHPAGQPRSRPSVGPHGWGPRPAFGPAVAVLDGGEVTDTSTIIQLDSLTRLQEPKATPRPRTTGGTTMATVDFRTRLEGGVDLLDPTEFLEDRIPALLQARGRPAGLAATRLDSRAPHPRRRGGPADAGTR